jgi:hypothetical protein
MAPRSPLPEGHVRKLITFDGEVWNALRLLARDSMKDLQELADEAFADLLRKHHRPVTLKEALRASARVHSEARPASPRRRRAQNRRS